MTMADVQYMAFKLAKYSGGIRDQESAYYFG